MSATGWVLGTFHTAVVGLALLLLAYPGGGLGTTLANLSTAAGLALFVALWVSTLFATSRALAGLDLLGGAATGYGRRAIIWGGANGILFLWSFAAILTLQQAVTAPGTLRLDSLLLGAGFVAGIGTLFAFGIGGLIGLALASVDLAALAIARGLSGG
jgi:hypothetical protein